MPDNTCSIFVQPLKAELPIEVTDLPIVTEVRPMQEEKALLPIKFTELGMLTEVRPRQYSKA